MLNGSIAAPFDSSRSVGQFYDQNFLTSKLFTRVVLVEIVLFHMSFSSIFASIEVKNLKSSKVNKLDVVLVTQKNFV